MSGLRGRGRVSHRGVDGHTEQVADAADVAAGGVDLLQDAVLAQRLGSQVGAGPRELAAGGREAGRAPALVDTAMPRRRSSARNRSASSQVAVHTRPASDRANCTIATWEPCT